MKEAWQVAELLEELAINADPYSVMRNQIGRLLGNARAANVMVMSQPDYGEKSWTLTYFVPVALAMDGVKGTPEDVVEFFKTGNVKDRDVSLCDNFPDKPCFALKCVYRDENAFHDLEEVMDRFAQILRERGHLPEPPSGGQSTPGA